jgi:hypothetical protein
MDLLTIDDLSPNRVYVLPLLMSGQTMRKSFQALNNSFDFSEVPKSSYVHVRIGVAFLVNSLL